MRHEISRLERELQEYRDKYKEADRRQKEYTRKFDAIRSINDSSQTSMRERQSARKSMVDAYRDAVYYSEKAKETEKELAKMKDRHDIQVGNNSHDLEMMQIRERLLEKELEIERLRQQGARAENEEIKGLVDTIRRETGN